MRWCHHTRCLQAWNSHWRCIPSLCPTRVGTALHGCNVDLTLAKLGNVLKLVGHALRSARSASKSNVLASSSEAFIYVRTYIFYDLASDWDRRRSFKMGSGGSFFFRRLRLCFFFCRPTACVSRRLQRSNLRPLGFGGLSGLVCVP